MASVVVDENGCWLWQKYVKENGYGQIGSGGSQYAHRVAYEAWKGPIPDGLTLDHLCRVRHCCNPDHLEPVTHQVNNLRGEGPAAIRAAVETCPAGHPYDEENTYWRPKRGGRDCRKCRAEGVRRQQARGAAVHREVPPDQRQFEGRAVKTHCPKDHPYDGENLYIDSRGHRQCRECRREAVRRQQARKRDQQEGARQ